jgi:DNA-binding transcriptional LysR family regulator
VASDLLLVRDLVGAGAGLGFLSNLLAEGSPGVFVPVLPEIEMQTGSLWIVYPTRRNVPRKVTAFRELLLGEMQRRA